MKYINTTFAHGNGPYARTLEWAIEVNNVLEDKGKERLPIVVPLVYGERQKRIMKVEIENNVSSNYFTQHQQEIWIDHGQGEILDRLMFKGLDYSDNLRLLLREYKAAEALIHEYLNGRKELENFYSGEKEIFDMRDCSFQLGLNNQMQTGLPNQFYTTGGAGPFDELLERAIREPSIALEKDSMRSALPIARNMIENQIIIFSNDPGVFSYDERIIRDNEIYTPCFIHHPTPDKTNLPKEGVYLLMTGIDGIRESSLYDTVADLGMQIYTSKFLIDNMPASIKEKTIPLEQNQINNPDIRFLYARAGWSSVWLSHLCQKGFLTPRYQKTDDPEMLFNERVIKKLGLGAIIEENPRKALEESIELAKNVGKFNEQLFLQYGTLDGIKYSAEKVVDFLLRKNIL